MTAEADVKLPIEQQPLLGLREAPEPPQQAEQMKDLEKANDDEVAEYHMPFGIQVTLVTVAGLTAAYFSLLFPIEDNIASWLNSSKLYASLLLGIVNAPYALSSYGFKQVMYSPLRTRADGDERTSYWIWWAFSVAGSSAVTVLLFFPQLGYTTKALLVVAQIVAGFGQGINFVTRQLITITTTPKTRVFYYALNPSSVDGGIGFGILLTGLIRALSSGETAVNGTPIYLVLPTLCYSCIITVTILCLEVFGPRKPRVTPHHLRQHAKPPARVLVTSDSDTSDDRKRRCILSCYLVGFNRVLIKTMWFSVALDVWRHVFGFSILGACISVCCVILCGCVLIQIFAYFHHALHPRTWMRGSEIAIFTFIFLGMVVDLTGPSTSLIDDDDVGPFGLYVFRLGLFYFSSLGLYLSCQINSNVTNVHATLYAIREDKFFDQPAISFAQTALQVCLAKALAPVVAAALWTSGGFAAYNFFSLTLSASTIVFSNLFIIPPGHAPGIPPR